jgi:hypothetical protein
VKQRLLPRFSTCLRGVAASEKPSLQRAPLAYASAAAPSKSTSQRGTIARSKAPRA